GRLGRPLGHDAVVGLEDFLGRLPAAAFFRAGRADLLGRREPSRVLAQDDLPSVQLNVPGGAMGLEKRLGVMRHGCEPSAQRAGRARGRGPAALLVAATQPAAKASRSVPRSLLVSTSKAAMAVAAGDVTTAVVSAKVVALHRGGLCLEERHPRGCVI